MNHFLFLGFSHLIIAQYITYDKGSYNQYLTTCQNSMSHSQIFTFNGQFAIPPQIIITSFAYDTTPAPIQLTFDITNIMTTSFTFQIKCLQTTTNIYAYKFNWVAIDDQRIEVINSYNTDVTGLMNKVFTLPHQNMNALHGFISMINLGFTGPIDFSFNIQSISLSEVIVEFTAANTNLCSIGFQVILGTSESFSISNIISSYVSTTVFYDSPLLTIPNGNIPLIPYNGLNYANTINLRLSTSSTFSATQFSYRIQCWASSELPNLNHQLVWMNVSNSKVIYPFQLLKMSFTKTYSQFLDINPWKVFVSEFNQTFTTPSTQQIIVQKGIQSLTVQISAQCDQVLLTGIKGSVLQCSTCIPQNKSFSQNCSNEINILKYHFILYQVDQINQLIYFNVTSTGFILYESAIQREGQINYTLIDLQVLNYI